jgi:hypothetical protein
MWGGGGRRAGILLFLEDVVSKRQVGPDGGDSRYSLKYRRIDLRLMSRGARSGRLASFRFEELFRAHAVRAKTDLQAFFLEPTATGTKERLRLGGNANYFNSNSITLGLALLDFSS